jgi:AmpE protein
VVVLPVAAVMFLAGGALLGFPYLLLAIVVLFVSLGPQDIGEDVDEYCRAVEARDEERLRQTTKAIIERDMPDDTRMRIRCVEEAVCVQASNRLFAIVFWFVVLGPLGAWAYRAVDLVRRRAVFTAARDVESDGLSVRLRDAAVTLHGWVAWLPARLTALGYAAAGHFDAAIGAWRSPAGEPATTTSESNERLLARVGVAALALDEGDDDELEDRAIHGATAANRLVFRLLTIWAVVIAAMTLYGWTR